MNSYSSNVSENCRGDVRFKLATALIGRTVGLLIGRKTITRGVVSAVLTEGGDTQKLVVRGARYDVSQILTVTPTASNC